jgi:hypothetical protein
MAVEIARGKEYFPGWDVARWWLSHEAHQRDPQRFLANFEAVLGIFAQHAAHSSLAVLRSVTLAAAALQCSTRSEMIDLRVLGGDVAGRIEALKLVTTFIPDDLWPELLRAAPDPSSG